MIMKLKQIAATLALAASLAVSTQATPLNQKHVASDAKWLLHIDFDQFRNSNVGTFVFTDLMQQATQGLDPELRKQLDFKAIQGITAYGNSYEMEPDANGVLILKTDAGGQLILQGLIAAQLAAGTNAPIKEFQKEPYVLYSMNNEFYGGFTEDGSLVVGKSKTLVEEAHSVISGKGSNLSRSVAFSGYPDVPSGFFFLAVADAFNDNKALPPQANVLKMADGARIALGESSEKLFVNLVLKTKTKDASTQIQQVLQGMMALLALSQAENKDLSQLMQATKIASSEKAVSISIEYPVKVAIEKITAMLGGQNKGKEGDKEKSELERSEKSDEGAKEKPEIKASAN
jgi:hypothetical protein